MHTPNGCVFTVILFFMNKQKHTDWSLGFEAFKTATTYKSTLFSLDSTTTTLKCKTKTLKPKP